MVISVSLVVLIVVLIGVLIAVGIVVMRLRATRLLRLHNHANGDAFPRPLLATKRPAINEYVLVLGA